MLCTTSPIFSPVYFPTYFPSEFLLKKVKKRIFLTNIIGFSYCFLGCLCTGNVYLLAGTRRDRGYRCITVICLLLIVGYCLFCAFQYPFVVLALPTLLNVCGFYLLCSVLKSIKITFRNIKASTRGLDMKVATILTFRNN